MWIMCPPRTHMEMNWNESSYHNEGHFSILVFLLNFVLPDINLWRQHNYWLIVQPVASMSSLRNKRNVSFSSGPNADFCFYWNTQRQWVVKLMSQLRYVVPSCLLSVFQTFFFGLAIVFEVRDGNEARLRIQKCFFSDAFTPDKVWEPAWCPNFSGNCKCRHIYSSNAEVAIGCDGLFE